ILFICGGAFEGLEDIISRRVGGGRAMGFQRIDEADESKAQAAMMAQVIPEDLLKYGLIPEFVGRLPMVVSLEPLDKEMLIRILTEPKNAVIKQYQKFFALDRVELAFNTDAVEAVADRALNLKTGARGLRSTIDEVLLDIMYELPSMEGVRRCVVTEDVIRHGSPPLLLTRSDRDPAPDELDATYLPESA
ncbi:MAG TPA: ATP-dependent Clp protease ATP-binding subunit ClpX, partial [Chloroflexia bacterium]|nr:ATP-dependent Clp protease ATP-binding subunit ClpX [Chloroflexia bacterium]